MSLESIQADFNRIARLLADKPDSPDRYESFLLTQLPAPCAKVLEIGCGAGRLTRAISGRGATVTGIDASPEMIRLARNRTRDSAGVEFVCGDFSVLSMEPGTYDCVVSVATLHHLPTEQALSRMKSLLRPGGMLVIHDIRSPSGVVDWMVSGLAALVTGDAVWWVSQRLREGRALRDAWREHGSEERYLTMAEVRSLGETTLPGSRGYWHPLWRYTIVWTKGRAAA
jgi:2-polyprenyl-3-methyl-5-hydroxy-6-metoxy-1,4-benzoquinol methylase